MDKRERERVEIAGALSHFIFKVTEKNGQSEYTTLRLVDISEKGLKAQITESFVEKPMVGDKISGVVKSETFPTSLPVSGKITRLGTEKDKNVVAIEFEKEITLPTIIIAHAMAVA